MRYYSPSELERETPFDYEPLETRAQRTARLAAAELAKITDLSELDVEVTL